MSSPAYYVACRISQWLHIVRNSNEISSNINTSSSTAKKPLSLTILYTGICPKSNILTLLMLRLLSFKSQEHNDFWKTSKPYQVGIHCKALAEYSQMSTHLLGFQIYFRVFKSFCIGQIRHQQHKGLKYHILNPDTEGVWGVWRKRIKAFNGDVG